MKLLTHVILLVCLTTPLSSHADNKSEALTLADTRHLLERTGLGASPAEISQLIGLSRAQAVDRIVNDLGKEPHTPAPAWTTGNAPQHWRFGDFSPKEKQKFRQLRSIEMQSLRRWWVQEMISTPHPQTERLVLFWHNHFATAYASINHQSLAVARQHMMLREHGAGNFRTLLKAVIRDPAMLNYLDNNASVKAKPNENLARELMELFTLGEGNYTEADVKNAARALTGYSYSDVYDQRFIFKQWSHDKGIKEIFGQKGNFDGDNLIDLILEQPAAAEFIAHKLWRMLVSDNQPAEEVIAAQARVFRESDFDIKTLYKSILLSDGFWHAGNRATIAKSPASLTIGAIRTTGVLPADWQVLSSQLAQMGQHLFDPPNVAGWPGGGSWITPGRLLTRLEWLKKLGDSTDEQFAGTPAMTMPSMQQNTMSSQSAPSMSDDNTMMMANSEKQLLVRMASEEFDDSAQYKVSLMAEDRVLWSSGVKQLKGGHDTKRMGRIDRKNMPWQVIAFPVNVNESAVRAVEIEFLNDGTSANGADRNLFVSQITLGDKVWLPRDGTQNTKCPPKKPEQQGNLYCGGALRIEKSAAVATTTPLNKHTIRVSGADFRFIRRPNKKPSAEVAFVLSDVEFEDRFWTAMIVRYVKDKDSYTIRMSNLDCWPQCLLQWPECAWKNKYNLTTLSASLTPKSQEEHCMYDNLQPADQRLIDALWMLSDDLQIIAANSRKLNYAKNETNLKKWQPHFAAMQKQLASSPYFNDKITLDIVTRPMQDSTQHDLLTTPLPAGLTPSERQNSLKQLQQRETDLNLASLLLATEPAQAKNPASLKLNDVITDLVFQLK